MNPNQFDEKRRDTLLRIEAEARLTHTPPLLETEQSAAVLLRELQVHQIELEIQNEELRRTQVALESSRDRYVHLYEFAPVGYLTLSDKGLITEINLTGAGLLGISPSARSTLIKQPISALICHEDQNIFYLHSKQLLESGQPQAFDLRMRKHDGTQFWANITASAAREADAEPALRVVLSDISERKESENMLRDSKRRLSDILESVDAHIYLKDTQGRFLFANRPVRELFGASMEEIVGRTDGHFFDAETFAQIRHNDRLVLEQGIISKKEETAFNLKDGHSSTYLSIKIPLRNEAGEIYALCGISTDITVRKQAEEQLLRSMQKLEEKELAKTRFLAAAGHDLRQPVAAANLFVDALKLTSPTPRQNELIARLDQSMGIFSGLLERLLDISKFDAGLIKPQIASFNLEELFHWLEQNFAQSALEQKLRFKLFFPLQQALIVRTDIFLLQSVLMNLVSNAIKFTTLGGILISARRRGNSVLLQVWDSGIGIAEADMPHVFDEFYQAANPQRNREAGLGLGLSICQRAMSLLGSEVTCRSRPGHGSVFEISLPLNGETHEIKTLPVADTPENAAHTLIQGKRVVVLEDDALVAAGMVNLLRGLGAEVRLFHDAEKALRDPDIAKTDYFIVDYALGGEITGLNFLVAVQQRQHTPICAVVLTGETSSQFIRNVADSPWPVLHKPVSYAKLIDSLHQ